MNSIPIQIRLYRDMFYPGVWFDSELGNCSNNIQMTPLSADHELARMFRNLTGC